MNLISGVCITWKLCCVWLLLSCFAEVTNGQAGTDTNSSNVTSVLENAPVDPKKASEVAKNSSKKIAFLPVEGGMIAVPVTSSTASPITNIPSTNSSNNTTHGENKLNTPSSQSKASTKAGDATHVSREGIEVQSKPNVTTASEKTEEKTPTSNTKNQTKNTINTLGDNLAKTVPTNNTFANSTVANNTDSEVKPVYEAGTKNDGKPSVPRKEPKMDDFPETPETSTTATLNITKPVEKPKKPLFTEATDDFPPLHFDLSDKLGQSKKQSSDNIPSLEKVEQRQHKSANYVVPIVGVILSVPLVAVIISVLYKRFSEWWHHRHYRRMDFLIEGMYNN